MSNGKENITEFKEGANADETNSAEYLDKLSVYALKIAFVLALISALCYWMGWESLFMNSLGLAGLSMVSSYTIFVVACAIDCMVME